jgi:hypothetical protein
MPRAAANKIPRMCASLASATISWANAQFLILFQRHGGTLPSRRHALEEARIDAMGAQVLRCNACLRGVGQIAERAAIRPAAEMRNAQTPVVQRARAERSSGLIAPQ